MKHLAAQYELPIVREAFSLERQKATGHDLTPQQIEQWHANKVRQSEQSRQWRAILSAEGKLP